MNVVGGRDSKQVVKSRHTFPMLKSDNTSRKCTHIHLCLPWSHNSTCFMYLESARVAICYHAGERVWSLGVAAL